MSFLLAVLLPCLLWKGPTPTADQLRQMQIKNVCISKEAVARLTGVTDTSVESIDEATYVKVPAPSMTFRQRVASPTRAPWINLNGWRFVRAPQGRFYCRAPGAAAALAAAEMFAYGVHAAIDTDADGLRALGQMQAFLSSVADVDLPPQVNIGFIDDGSAEAGEFMNLLVRRNLLFRVVQQPDPTLDLTASLGRPEYPRSEAANPQLLAEKVRAHLTDEKRLLRIYGSDVVVGRLVGRDGAARLYLLNYGGAKYPIQGVRVRVLGSYSSQRVSQFGSAKSELQDVSVRDGATEFTLPRLETISIIDLSR